MTKAKKQQNTGYPIESEIDKKQNIFVQVGQISKS